MIRRTPDHKFLIIWSSLLAASGLITLALIDPIWSPPADLPRVAVYLAPFSLLAAGVFLALSKATGRIAAVAVPAIVSILAVLAILPSFLRIANGEPYLTHYFDEHPTYYRTGGLALRDAHFYLGNLNQANFWDQKLVVKSDDYLNFQGCLDLAATGKAAEAARILTRTVAGHPYWTEARSLLALCYLELGRQALAKPHIDTCLMLAPYTKDHLMNLYRYYRAVGNTVAANEQLARARTYWPHSTDVASEQVMIWFTEGMTAAADSLATSLLKRDSTLALPHLAKGRLAEQRGDVASAIRHYENFITWGKYRPEAQSIYDRLLTLRRAEQSQP